FCCPCPCPCERGPRSWRPPPDWSRRPSPSPAPSGVVVSVVPAGTAESVARPVASSLVSTAPAVPLASGPAMPLALDPTPVPLVPALALALAEPASFEPASAERPGRAAATGAAWPPVGSPSSASVPAVAPLVAPLVTSASWTLAADVVAADVVAADVVAADVVAADEARLRLAVDRTPLPPPVAGASGAGPAVTP